MGNNDYRQWSGGETPNLCRILPLGESGRGQTFRTTSIEVVGLTAEELGVFTKPHDGGLGLGLVNDAF